MSNQTTTTKKELSQNQKIEQLATKKVQKKEPDFYLFRLTRNIPKDMVPYQRIGGGPFVLKSEDLILWAFHEPDENGISKPFSVNEVAPPYHDNFQIRKLRYIPSLPSVFEDEQKGITERKIGEVHPILDSIIIRNEITFQNGELRINSKKKNLFHYLRFNSQCKSQHPNVRQLNPTDYVFDFIDFGNLDALKVQEGAKKERAWELAHTARVEHLIPHAKFLNILFKDPLGFDRTIDAIRYDYKEIALSNPNLFISSFDDPKIKLIYKISILTEAAEIVILNGVARWAKTNSIITQIPANEQQTEYLAKYALSEDGKDFEISLNSIFNNYKNRIDSELIV